VKVGAPEFQAKKSKICEPCILATQMSQALPNGESETAEVLELVHKKVCRPLKKRSKGGSRSFATFINDYNKLSVAILIAKKCQVLAVVKSTVAQLELQRERSSRRSERVGEVST
jgi:hypothetical protein